MRDKKLKQHILDSRLLATKTITTILKKLKQKPNVLINASAIGYYGTSLTKTFTENSAEHGDDFLASVVHQWEKEAILCREDGVRCVLARFGIILGKEGGALPKMMIPYRLFAGGSLGSGQQWMSWIHIEDAVRMIEFAIHQKDVDGPINVVSPTPLQMKDFGQTLASVMHRPHYLKTPAFLLKLALGEMSMLVLKGQKVMPKTALERGFSFTFPSLNPALMNILKSD